MCSRYGLTLDSEWDGFSEEVPVLIPLSSDGYIGHMGSRRATAKLSCIKEVYFTEIVGEGTPLAHEGDYI